MTSPFLEIPEQITRAPFSNQTFPENRFDLTSDQTIVSIIQNYLNRSYVAIPLDLTENIQDPSLKNKTYANISIECAKKGYVLAAEKAAQLILKEKDSPLRDLAYQNIAYAHIRNMHISSAKQALAEIQNPQKKQFMEKKIQTATRKWLLSCLHLESEKLTSEA